MNEAPGSGNRPFIQLAPMEGVLDWVLREQLSAVGGLDRMVTEFVRVTDRLLPDHVFHKYCPELNQGGKTLAGTPVFMQLLGGEADPVAENAARVVEIGAPGVDLNFGCPAKTVNRHDGGAALLQRPRRLYDVTSAVRKAVPSHIPVTAKVRLGFEHKDFHKEIAQAVEEAGASHIVVHARTKKEMYTPPAHWEYIASMREGRSLKFLANGEIWSVADYHACVAKSGVQDVALGRGLVRRPTLALEIRQMSCKHFDRIAFLREFFERSREFRGAAYAVPRIKQILRYWSQDPTGSRPADDPAKIWFNAVKMMSDEKAVREYVESLTETVTETESETEKIWPKSNSTHGPIAPFACAPKTY